MYFIKFWFDWNADQYDGVDFMAKVKPVAHRGARKAAARGISKRKASGSRRAAPVVSSQSGLAVEDQLVSSSLSLPELFQQQARQILVRSRWDLWPA
jgi:hypothetical protein